MLKYTLIVLSIACLFFAAGCGSKSSSGQSSDATGGPSDSGKADKNELTEMDVVLDWYPNAIHTFLYEAKEKGYFEEEGIKVNLIPPAESVDALTFVSSKKAQIGLTYPVEVVKSYAAGMKVRALGAVTRKDLCVFTTLKGSGVTSDLATLKGKKIGYDGTAASEAKVRTAARNAGLADKDYELINVGFDLVTALTTGSVDMTSGMMINDEVITMKKAGYDVEVYPYSDYGVPEMYDIVMVANEEEYRKNEEVYNGFVRACNKGFRDMKASEEESLSLIMDKMNSDENPLDRDQQKESYETLLPCMETDDEPFLSMSDECWEGIIRWMKENELIDREVKPSEVMTDPAF